MVHRNLFNVHVVDDMLGKRERGGEGRRNRIQHVSRPRPWLDDKITHELRRSDINQLCPDAGLFTRQQIRLLESHSQRFGLTKKPRAREFHHLRPSDRAKMVAIATKESHQIGQHRQTIAERRTRHALILLAPQQRKGRWADRDVAFRPPRKVDPQKGIP